MKRINGLDALRGIAVLLVIITHWGPHGFKTLPVFDFIIKYIIPSGSFAVDLFFVLSGFLITGILLKSKRESKTGSNVRTLKIFIIRRALRIFPIYYLLLLLLYIFNYPDIRQYVLYFLTYTSNYLSFKQSSWNQFSHTWSLSVEEQFYLIWPLLMLFIPNKYIFKLMLVLIVSSTVINGLTEYRYGGFADVLTINCFNAFAIGGLYSLALIEREIGAKVKNFLLWLLPFAIIFYILQYFNITIIPLRIINAIIAINLIIYVVEHKYGRIASVFIDNKQLNSLGKISYGVYLFHYIIPYYYNYFLTWLGINNKSGNTFSHLLFIPLIAEALQFTFLICLSSFSFYYIEVQILKLKRLYRYQQ